MKNLITIPFLALLLIGTKSQAQIELPSDCFEKTKNEINDIYWGLSKFYYSKSFECRMLEIMGSIKKDGQPDFYEISHLLYKEIDILNQTLESMNNYQIGYAAEDIAAWKKIKYWITQLYNESRNLNSLMNDVNKLSGSSQSDYDDNWFFALLNDIGTYGTATEKKEQLEKSWGNFRRYGNNAFDTHGKYDKAIKSNLITELQTIFKKFTCVDNFVYEAMVSEDDKKEWFIEAINEVKTLYPGYDDLTCQRKPLINLLEESKILFIYKDAMDATFYYSFD